MQNEYAGIPPTLDSPARRAFSITPSDTDDLPFLTRALFCGGGGTIIVVDEFGNEVALTNTQAGQVIPLRVSRVRASSASLGSPTLFTSATGIIGLS